MKFKCKKCWDTGYLGNRKCHICFKGYANNKKLLLKEFIKRRSEESDWRIFSGDYTSVFNIGLVKEAFDLNM